MPRTRVRSANGEVKREGADMFTRQVLVKMTEADELRLINAAIEEDRSVAGQVRYILRQWLDAREMLKP